MADTEQRELRREIGEERAKLADAVGELRTELDRATEVGRKLRKRVPLVAGGTLGLAGFVKAGGLGAIARLVRRGR